MVVLDDMTAVIEDRIRAIRDKSVIASGVCLTVKQIAVCQLPTIVADIYISAHCIARGVTSVKIIVTNGICISQARTPFVENRLPTFCEILNLEPQRLYGVCDHLFRKARQGRSIRQNPPFPLHALKVDRTLRNASAACLDHFLCC